MAEQGLFTAVSRRQVLILFGAGGAAMLLASCVPAAAPTQVPPVEEATASTPAAATTSVAAPEKEAKLLVWHTMGGGTPLEAFEALLAEYSEQHPQISFELTMVPGSSEVGPYQEKITTAIAGGTPPDLLHMNFPPQFGEAGMLIALNDFVDVTPGFDADDYFEGAWYRNTWRDKIWGLPVLVDCRALWWNKAIFEEVGLDPEVPPKTWSDLEEMSLKCNTVTTGGDIERIGYIPTYGNDHFYGWNYCNGGELLEQKPDKDYVVFNNDTGVETLSWMVKITDSNGGIGAISAFREGFLSGADSPFFIGAVAMMINGVWVLDEVKRYAPDIEFGLATEPIGPSGTKSATLIGGYNWSIPKGAKHPDETWEFLYWFSSRDQQIKFCAPQRALPSRKSAMNAPYIQEDEDLLFFFKNLDNGRPFFAGPYRQIMWDACNVKAVQEALYHRKGPKEALDEAALAVQAEIDKFYASRAAMS